MPRINVTKSLLPDREKFHAYVDQILDSGWLTNRGPLVREFEEKLEDYLGVKNIVVVANGTLALQIAYKLLSLQGEVITTPFTFIATASSLKWEGLEPIFADINKDTFNIDTQNIIKKITSNTSAILPVHVFGNPCEVEAIDTIAKEHNLKVIYDAAHAFAVKYKGKSILHWGDISILSFHATKLFHTIEGGALIIKDCDLYAQARKMVSFGFTGPESIHCLGINAKMNEFQAAMGLCLLDDINLAISRRAKITAMYDSILSRILVKQTLADNTIYNYGYYPVVFKDEATTKSVQNALNRKNIFPRRYFYPSLDTLKFLTDNQQATNSSDIASRILCLPLSTELTDDECLAISRIITQELRAE